MANHANGAPRARRAPTASHPKRNAAPLLPTSPTPDLAASAPKRRAKPRVSAIAVKIAERDALAPTDSATPDVTIIGSPTGAFVTDSGADTPDGVTVDQHADARAVDEADEADDVEAPRDGASNDSEDADERADDANAGNDDDDDEWQVGDAGDDDVEEQASDEGAAEAADHDARAPADMGEGDFYAMLGVEPGASHEELRQAYRRLAKLWHPDRYASAPPALRAQAERRMRALNAAYFVVGDAIRRHLYDQRRADVSSLAGAGRSYGRGYAAPRNGYRSAADATDYTGYTAWSGASQGGALDHASENPNGAGVFFGALALVVGVGLFVGATQSGSAWVFVFGGVILAGLIILALIFSSHTSPFANAATRLMEGEPAGFGDPYVAAGAAGWRGTRYADRAPRRTAGGRKGAGGRYGARSATRSQPPANTRGATNGRGPTSPDAPTLGEEPTSLDTSPDTTPATPTDETSVTTSADAQPPAVNDEAAAFARFQQDVVDAVEALPAEFREQMGNIVVRVADEPDAATLRKMRTGKGHTLFGLYEGVPLTKQGATLPPPEIVTIYRGPITRACQGDPARIREQARRTVFHEVAHHFGIDHDDMPEWVK